MKRREIDTKIWKTGNSYVVTIPINLVRKWNLKEGQELTIIIRNAPEASDFKGRGTEDVLRTNQPSNEAEPREI
ncbi:TPA: AbrB/MazE/SpoVT family DNA-binding domain-containing protein [Candidatus Woesearchaeota archaeon]|nr:AbrB/MazE/SpoVT family DNA-binding domain-containing protein [Candidatus Woesearchaeota archaeon]